MSSDTSLEGPPHPTLRDGPQYFHPDPDVVDSLSSRPELGIDVLRWAEPEAVDSPSLQPASHPATPPGKGAFKFLQGDDSNGQASFKIAAIIIAGFLALLVVYRCFRWIVSPSVPDRYPKRSEPTDRTEHITSVIDPKTDDVYFDLPLCPAGSEPVTVRTADAQAEDSAISSPPETDNKVFLDAERVASLMAENVHVSSVLAGIFPDNESKEDLEERKEETASNFPGLDAKHAAFLGELLPRPHWEEAEFVTLAGQFRLMQAGALENLKRMVLRSLRRRVDRRRRRI